jgi:Cft2 family RNA processing exonuclease
LQALSFSIKKKVASAIATGWPYRSHYDKVFPLSDHADYNQLLEYVKEAKPKTVLTSHGFAKEFAHAVQRKLKIPARELDAKGQSILSEFE